MDINSTTGQPTKSPARKRRPKITYRIKSTAQTYAISCEGGTWLWANITINEEDGSLQIQSDYGDHGYMWPRHGRPSFKHFLVELGNDYLINKLSMGKKDVFDLDKSIKAIRKELREAKKNRDITKEKFDSLMLDVDEVESNGPGSAEAFGMMVLDTSLSDFYQDGYPPCYTGPAHDLLLFVEKIWPAFKKILKKEIGV